ncbi:MAG: PAS domain-containing protein, partial [Bacilli bacterium]
MNTNTYKIVVDKSPRGYACIELVFNGQGEAIDYIIIDINPSFARLTKKEKSALINHSLSEVFLTNNSSHWMGKIIELMKQGGTTEEIKISDAAGSQYFGVVVSPVDETHYIVLLSDLTDTMQKVKESENKYKLIVDCMSDFVWVLSLDHQIQFISPSIERILGYTVEEISHFNLSDFTTPESNEVGLNILEEIKTQALLGTNGNIVRTFEL